jgi:hypothetical protein
LAGCVPQLQPYCCAIDINVFGDEVDSHSWIMGWVKLVFDESIYDGAFSNGLIADEY